MAVWVSGSAGVGVSGKIRLVAARQAKVEKRTASVVQIRCVRERVMLWQCDPTCIQQVQVNISDKQNDPANHLQAVHQGLK